MPIVSYVYFTKWMKAVCAVYEPGVRFDFLLDDYIVPRLNNISESDVEVYRKSREAVLDFIQPYQPDNLEMTHTSEGGLFDSRDAYERTLDVAIKEAADSLPGGLPDLNDAEKASVELNTKPTPEQLADPKWREKVELLHGAYYAARNTLGYYGADTNNTIAFTQPFGPGLPLCVGSTKDTVAKYWAGVGVLKQQNDSYRAQVLSPKQLEAASFKWESVKIDGLRGKNFSKIRVTKR